LKPTIWTFAWALVPILDLTSGILNYKCVSKQDDSTLTSDW
jgi:hypothetical protein